MISLLVGGGQAQTHSLLPQNVETHFIVYFIFTAQKFTKSETKIKISSNDRKMGMEGGLDSTNQHDILRQVVILILHPANL